MNNNRTFLSIMLTFSTILSFSQTKIIGTVKDENYSSLTSANVILFENNKIIEFTKSDNKGFFQIEKQLLEGIYLIEIAKFGFVKFNQNIVVGTDNKQQIDLNILLNTTDFIELKEIKIISKPPIIVKKDTIIYNIDKLKDVYDNNLEQVLAKIQGFKIQANGEIEVNGKIIRKVIIDGKEVSDLGSALLTKTLSPNDIKEIEVRFDEKNNKLKESLIDEGKFVILDIKLKEDLNKTFFGNIIGNVGYQKNYKIGSYSNFFSLNKKVNIQAFEENSNFGNNKITLEKIRNIGEEANAKMFLLPIDYNEVKKRKGLNDELYGFNNFIQNDNSILGLSINYALNEKTDLFIGSFNNYHFIKNQSFTNQYYINDLINSIDLNNTQIEYNSKNKIQLKHTSDKIKLKIDFNYSWFKNKLVNKNKDQNSNDFASKYDSSNFYLNNSFEYVFSKKVGLISNVSLSNENYNIDNNLQTTDLNLANFLGSSLSESLFFFNQKSFNREQNFITELKIIQKTNWGNHVIGFKYYSNFLYNNKISINSTDTNFDFLNPKQKLYYDSNSLLYNYQKSIVKFVINANLELSQVHFPNNKISANYFQYNINVVYSPNEFTNMTLIAARNLSKYSLEKTINGLYLSNFQIVFEPSIDLTPTYNDTFSLTYFKLFKDYKLEINSAILYGKAQNLDNQFYQNYVIVQKADQLASSYTAFSTTLIKNFKNFPFKITFEPEILNNQSDFIFNNQIKKNFSERYLFGLKIETKFKGNFDLNFISKFSKFVFKNNLNDFKNDLEFLSNSLTVKTNFLDKSLIFMSTFRNVYFFSNNNNFSNLDISISKKIKNLNLHLILSNLLNTNKFITKDFNQVLFTTNENVVFGRYISFAVEYKIK